MRRLYQSTGNLPRPSYSEDAPILPESEASKCYFSLLKKGYSAQAAMQAVLAQQEIGGFTLSQPKKETNE